MSRKFVTSESLKPLDPSAFMDSPASGSESRSTIALKGVVSLSHTVIEAYSEITFSDSFCCFFSCERVSWSTQEPALSAMSPKALVS